jgi:hypothetical protein
MPLFLSESQIPEIGLLPATLRRAIVRGALVKMRKEARIFCWLPTLSCVIGGAAGWATSPVLLGAAVQLGYIRRPSGLTGDWLTLAMVCSYACMGVGAFSVGFIGLLLQRSRLRPYLCRTIAENVSIYRTSQSP